MNAPRPVTRFCLFGASPDTANLGVSALYLSIMNGIFSRLPDAQVTVFDHGQGVRRDQLTLPGGTYPITRIGANLSRRYYRRDSLFNMRLSALLGGLGNAGVAAIDGADAVFDISGGDSFADLYGPKRFAAMTQTKRLVLSRGRKLILMPQTYGPFDGDDARKVATGIVRDASMAWARDLRSYDTLKSLLGSDLDPALHQSGVDVAFALPKLAPQDVPATVSAWLAPDRVKPVIGFNVSGLIYNPGAEGSRQFGFKGDYREIVEGCVRRFLAESDANILLVPHVLVPAGRVESDTGACLALAEKLGAGDRVQVLDQPYDAMQMKWVISQVDFFCGTRMHSTIAGLSSGVPTAAIAYSLKTQGVFETCDQGDAVTDPRQVTADTCVADVLAAWGRRDRMKDTLAAALPSVLDQATRQFDEIIAHASMG